MPWFIFLYPISEIYLIYKIITTFSFLDAVGMWITTTLCGFIILKIMGKSVVLEVQKCIQQKRTPDTKVIHHAMIWVGALLLVIPGAVNDIVGLLLILPGFRHILFFWFRRVLLGQIKGGRMAFYSFSNMSGMKRTWDQYNSKQKFSNPSDVIDVKAEVIDTKATPIDTKPK